MNTFFLTAFITPFMCVAWNQPNGWISITHLDTNNHYVDTNCNPVVSFPDQPGVKGADPRLHIANWLNKLVPASNLSTLFCGSLHPIGVKFTNGTFVTLNKNGTLESEEGAGSINGLLGEAFVETMTNNSRFFVNPISNITVEPKTTLNIQNSTEGNFTITLYKGTFKVFHDTSALLFTEVGKRYCFDSLGKLISVTILDTTHSPDWTRITGYHQYLKNGRIKIKSF